MISRSVPRGSALLSSARLWTTARPAAALAPPSPCPRCSRGLQMPASYNAASRPRSGSARISGRSRSGARSASSAASPRAQRELPQLPDRRPLYLATAVAVLGAWALFTNYATNKEKLSSSVFRSVLVQLKDADRIEQALGGGPVKLEPGMFGDPWINGSVNMMQGKVDISFRIKGSTSGGTAYFTSIRRDMQRTFEVLRFLVVTDNGETVSMLDQDGSATHDSDGDMTFV